jgi:pimeloyl-ACP methyl ester carboxylesterase
LNYSAQKDYSPPYIKELFKGGLSVCRAFLGGWVQFFGGGWGGKAYKLFAGYCVDMLIYVLSALVALLVAVFLAVCFVFSSFILYSNRQPVVRSPKDYGLDFESLEFKSADGLNLKGWFIPGTTEKTVVITHPFPFNRHSFLAANQGWLKLFKTDVDLLKTAQAVNGAGYSVLMFDFRNHGESGSGVTGVGLNEYMDVVGAVNYLKKRFESPQVGFVSFCMGANSTLIALSKAKAELADVKCVVAVQPVSASVFVRSFMRAVFTPASLLLVPVVDKMCQWRGGYSLKEMSPLKYCRDVKTPVLYVQAKTDPWTELSDIEGFYTETAGPKETWMIEEKMGRFDAYNYVGNNPEKIINFLKQHL